MSYIGAALLVVGALAAALLFFGYAPDFLVGFGLSAVVWMAIAVAGAGLLWFNRRPGD